MDKDKGLTGRRRNRRISLYLLQAEYDQLAAWAVAQGYSDQEALRQLIARHAVTS
jgi:hypothetical protein